MAPELTSALSLSRDEQVGTVNAPSFPEFSICDFAEGILKNFKGHIS
jgi:hypothetical protein